MSIYDMLVEKGRKEGRKEGREEGRITALRRQLLFKFGCQRLQARYEKVLRTATPDAVDGYLQRVLTADSIAAVFAE